MKKIILMLTILAFTFACGNTKKDEKTKSTDVEITKVEHYNFEENAINLINKRIEITAMISHVCQHGGKKMFLVSKENEESIKVVLGENMASFKTDLVGNTVKVIGIVDELRIDEAYLVEWENEIKAEIEKAKTEAMNNSSGHVAGSKDEEADQGDHKDAEESIADYRKEIAESGTDHLSFFSIICEKYEVIKPSEN